MNYLTNISNKIDLQVLEEKFANECLDECIPYNGYKHLSDKVVHNLIVVGDFTVNQKFKISKITKRLNLLQDLYECNEVGFVHNGTRFPLLNIDRLTYDSLYSKTNIPLLLSSETYSTIFWNESQKSQFLHKYSNVVTAIDSKYISKIHKLNETSSEFEVNQIKLFDAEVAINVFVTLKVNDQAENITYNWYENDCLINKRPSDSYAFTKKKRGIYIITCEIVNDDSDNQYINSSRQYTDSTHFGFIIKVF